jgi:hypothetical protein
MGWVHTVPHTAKMIDLQSLADRTDEEFVGEAVGVDHGVLP